jgi:aminoglycoside phosphotransferase (APT) family kinase protein
VLLVSLDPSILGGAFLVMERLAGQPLLDARWLGVVPVLVEMQLRLHGLDAEVLLQALDREGRADSRTGGPPISREVVTFEGHLARLEQRVARASPHGLEKAVAWLAEHRPTVERRRVICHGDFHPQNLLVAHGRVTGVLDWPNVIVTDAEFDVASTLVILGLVPLALLGVPRALRGSAEVARRILVARYLRSYQRRRPLEAARLAYHEALACMRGLIRTAEARLAPVGEGRLTPLDASDYGERLAARFAQISGVTPSLPTAQL